MIVTAISNEKVKLFRALESAKGRKENGCYLAEGANLVKDIPQDADVLFTFVKESKAEEFEPLTSRFDCERVVLSDSLFDRISSTVTPIGVAAVVKIPKSLDISELSAEKAIVLDGVSDAGNVGAILRTAVAAGYKQAVFLNAADPYSPKAVRASMSAIFKIEPIFCDKRSFLCSKNISLYDIIVLDMGGEDIFSFRPERKIALIVGNEAHGVSPEIKSAGRKISIPMENMESLNAAVSAGVAMYVLGKNKR